MAGRAGKEEDRRANALETTAQDLVGLAASDPRREKIKGSGQDGPHGIRFSSECASHENPAVRLDGRLFKCIGF